jgi:hypothetical protein
VCIGFEAKMAIRNVLYTDVLMVSEANFSITYILALM